MELSGRAQHPAPPDHVDGLPAVKRALLQAQVRLAKARAAAAAAEADIRVLSTRLKALAK